MKLSVFCFNPFDENCYVVYDAAGGEALLVDPGMMTADECSEVSSFVADNGLTVRGVLLTHCHVDHVAGVSWARVEYGAPVMCSRDDVYLAVQMPSQVARFHLNIRGEVPVIDRYLAHGDTLTVGGERVEVIATPGHSRGSLSFYLPESALVLTGDTLFAGSLGRTDLDGGDLHTILRSINDRLLTLPPETMVAPGHGPVSTIGREQQYNPASGYRG